MKPRSIVAFSLFLIAGMYVAEASAEGEDSCSSACPSGQVKVSFLGGGENGDVACVCVDAPQSAEMPNDDNNYGDPDTSSHEYQGN